MATALEQPSIDRQIERLIAPGLAANRWRPDFEAWRHKRIWEELYKDRKVRALQTLAGSLEGKRILDLGCGRGGLSVALQRQGYEVVACDLRLRNCRVTDLRAQRYGLRAPSVNGIGERLPLTRECLDLVLCLDLIEHVENPAQVLGEVHRALRPGGSCYVTVVNRYCRRDPHYHIWFLGFLPRALAGLLIDATKRTKRSFGDRQEITDMHYFTHHEFKRLAESVGFRVIDSEELGLEKRLRKRGMAWTRRARLRLTLALYRVLRSCSLFVNSFTYLLVKPERG